MRPPAPPISLFGLALCLLTVALAADGATPFLDADYASITPAPIPIPGLGKRTSNCAYECHDPKQQCVLFGGGQGGFGNCCAPADPCSSATTCVDFSADGLSGDATSVNSGGTLFCGAKLSHCSTLVKEHGVSYLSELTIVYCDATSTPRNAGTSFEFCSDWTTSSTDACGPTSTALTSGSNIRPTSTSAANQQPSTSTSSSSSSTNNEPQPPPTPAVVTVQNGGNQDMTNRNDINIVINGAHGRACGPAIRLALLMAAAVALRLLLY